MPDLLSAQPYMLQKICCWHHRLDSLASCPFQSLATAFDPAPSLSSWSTNHAVRLRPATTRPIFTISDGVHVFSFCWCTGGLSCMQGCKATAGKEAARQDKYSCKTAMFSSLWNLFDTACWHNVCVSLAFDCTSKQI